MKVLYCSYEVAPFFKKGGLGDVAGSLPKALAKLGVDIRVVMPGYEIVQSPKSKVQSQFLVEFDGKKEEVGVWQDCLPGSEVKIYFLENEDYLSGLKEKKEKYEQFGFFSKAILEFISASGQILKQVRDDEKKIAFDYDLVHLNDWHTALVPLLLKLETRHQRPATLLTVHNFAHQGRAPLDIIQKLGLSKHSSRVIDWDISDQDFEMLMEGIIHADLVNTVSPTYAEEILRPGFIKRLSEVLKAKEARVKGILNGIDYSVWSPEIDPYLQVNFGLNKEQITKNREQIADNKKQKTKNWREEKRINKLALQKEMGLEENEEVPVLAFIGRLARNQKGLDILYQALVKLLAKENFQFILLGTGSKEWEEKFKKLATKPKRSVKSIGDRVSSLPIFGIGKKKGEMRAVIRFDEALAHRIYAGADFVVVPSKFEPCGLIQMIAMRYGTLPIVRKTGGLADTVQDGVNGFVFEEYSAEALAECIKRALMRHATRDTRQEMIERAMGEDFSWSVSAREYLKLYEKAVALKEG